MNESTDATEQYRMTIVSGLVAITFYTYALATQTDGGLLSGIAPALVFGSLPSLTIMLGSIVDREYSRGQGGAE